MSEKIFSIVMPAYNEESAIAGTLKNAVRARKRITAETDIGEVEIIVVNDGSHDKTAGIAQDFVDTSGVRLISFSENRGYGAAIKEGFRQARGEYVGFFDADNTCDPLFFVEMYRTMCEKNAHIVLGSRMHKDSKMPPVRRLGNKLYAVLINILWKTRITDSASGMRILRKDVLDVIYPLPDGLHFTPVMTCKALSMDGVSIVEIPMAYKERSGRSKLSVVKDGYRFLVTIFELGFSYRPFLFFGTIGMMFFCLSFLYGIPLAVYYLENRFIPEDMIYRVIAIVAFFSIGSILFFTNLIMKDFIAYARGKELTFEKPGSRVIRTITSSRNIIFTGLGILLVSFIFSAGSLWEYLATRSISRHWIYTMTGAFLFLQGTIVFIFGVAQHIIYTYKKKF